MDGILTTSTSGLASAVTTSKFVAYFDVLGYSDYLQDAEDEAGFYSSIRRAVGLANEINKQPEGYVTKTFSDNVVITTSEDNVESDFERLSHLITFMSFAHVLMLVDEGLLIRGCIVHDNVLVDNDVVFGRAIVSAHQTERDARFPRTVIHDSVFDVLSSEEVGVLPLVSIDDDGRRYIDYFRAMDLIPIAVPDGDNRPDREILVDVARTRIEGLLAKHGRYPSRTAKSETIIARERIIEKHAWVAYKFNDYCSEVDLESYSIPFEVQFNRRLMKPELRIMNRARQ